MSSRPALLSVMTLHRKERKRRTSLQEIYDGEVPNERDDEHMSLTFIVKAGGKNKKTFLVKYEAK